MGRTFFGPFKASAIVDLTFGKDDEVFLSLRDKKDDVLGLIIDREILAELLARSSSHSDGGHSYRQPSAHLVEPAPQFTRSGLHRAILKLFRLAFHASPTPSGKSTLRPF